MTELKKNNMSHQTMALINLLDQIYIVDKDIDCSFEYLTMHLEDSKEKLNLFKLECQNVVDKLTDMDGLRSRHHKMIISTIQYEKNVLSGYQKIIYELQYTYSDKLINYQNISTDIDSRDIHTLHLTDLKQHCVDVRILEENLKQLQIPHHLPKQFIEILTEKHQIILGEYTKIASKLTAILAKLTDNKVNDACMYNPSKTLLSKFKTKQIGKGVACGVATTLLVSAASHIGIYHVAHAGILMMGSGGLATAVSLCRSFFSQKNLHHDNVMKQSFDVSSIIALADDFSVAIHEFIDNKSDNIQTNSYGDIFSHFINDLKKIFYIYPTDIVKLKKQCSLILHKTTIILEELQVLKLTPAELDYTSLQNLRCMFNDFNEYIIHAEDLNESVNEIEYLIGYSDDSELHKELCDLMLILIREIQAVEFINPNQIECFFQDKNLILIENLYKLIATCSYDIEGHSEA